MAKSGSIIEMVKARGDAMLDVVTDLMNLIKKNKFLTIGTNQQ